VWTGWAMVAAGGGGSGGRSTGTVAGVPKEVDTADVQRLVEQGAQLVEVLPAAAHRREHLPGAVNIPLPELREPAVRRLDPDVPTVVYCQDHECDLSSRGAARLEALGFREVYDYAASKTAWLGCGLSAQGDVRDDDRVGARARRAVTCGASATIGDVADDLSAPGTEVVVVVDADGVVLGALHPAAASLPASTGVLAAADPGPRSVRPSITRFELARSMDADGQRRVLVTTSDGRLLGIVGRDDLG